MGTHKFYVGHVLDVLKILPDESVHCVVTSPPYFGLRDYGLPPVLWPEVEYSPMPGLPSVRIPAWRGQLGLEPSPEMYVGHIVSIFREVRRVLRRDGTLWLNLGDVYWGGKGRSSQAWSMAHQDRKTLQRPYHHIAGKGEIRPQDRPHVAIKPKDLAGIPWRVAFALQADGWWLRSDIAWVKKNPMPESVRDRPSSSWEHIFLFAKDRCYFYDYVAVQEPLAEATIKRSAHPFYPDRPKAREWRETRQGGGARDAQTFNAETYAKIFSGEKTTRNMRDVLWIATETVSENHFAPFPSALVMPCIKAGTSQKGCCPVCGAPWKRILETIGTTAGWHPTCSCGVSEIVPCVVLDPFGGTGTTTLVAARLGRSSIYIDMKREYAEMAIKRCGFLEARLIPERVEVIEVYGENEKGGEQVCEKL